MTSKDFIIWLKGFAKAANVYNITPAQWEAIVEELDKVQDKESRYPSHPLDPIKITPPWCTTTTDDKTILHD
jgi:hypothetical protein